LSLPEALWQEPHQERLPKELRDIPHAEPAHQIKTVDLDRPDADLERIGDLPIGQPLCDETKDFTLTRGEMIATPLSGDTS
jgi:hypothetical protein